MSYRPNHCTLVEIPIDEHGEPIGEPRDLLPWADPYISQLLSRYRLESALDDSSRFARDGYLQRSERSSFDPRGPGRNRLPQANPNWPRDDEFGMPRDW